MSKFAQELARLKREAAATVSHFDETSVKSDVVESAQFDIIIKRNSANIAEYLPFPVFGVGALKSGLGAEIANYLPSGVSLTAIQFGTTFSSLSTATLTEDLANAQKLVLEFTAGLAVDTVTITCSSTPYPQFVESTLSDVFGLSKIRYSISDVAQSDQYSQQLVFRKKTIFGKVVENPLTPTAFRKPTDFQTGVLDIDVNSSVDKETAIWHQIKNVANFTITLSVFVTRSVRFNANQL